MNKRYLLLVIIIILLVGCNQDIKIGYSSGTTGQLSQIGVDGRNAFLLRIKEANDLGGVNGHEIETLVLNDENDPNKVSAVHDEFEMNEYNLIVGHIISALDQAVLIEAKEDKLILSASMSSASMDRIDDNFIRLSSSYSGQVYRMIEELEADGVESLAVVYDMRNSAYAEGFYLMLKENTSIVKSSHPIGLDENVDEKVVVKSIMAKEHDAVLMITPASVTARLCQNFSLENIDLSKYGVSWSMSPELFEIGGDTVEDIKIVYMKQDGEYKEDYEAFRQRFKDEYGYEPSSICFNTYEVTSIMIEALVEVDSTNVEELKAYIVDRTFKGLYDDIVIDEYGDRNETFIMFLTDDGEFRQLD